MTEVLGWPLLGGIGLLLLLTGQPLGRPTPNLAARLAALRADPHPAAPPPTSYASPTLERLLVPPLHTAGRLLLHTAEALGVPTSRLAQRLTLAGEPGGPALHAGHKLLGGLVGVGVLPLLNQLAVTPFGPWPAWLWLAAGVIGFTAPDAALAHKVASAAENSCRGWGRPPSSSPWRCQPAAA